MTEAQLAAPVTVPSKELFIAWAVSHGELDLTEASEFASDGEIPKCKNGWVPAKFYYPETEIAWRAWANSKAAPVSDGAMYCADAIRARTQPT